MVQEIRINFRRPGKRVWLLERPAVIREASDASLEMALINARDNAERDYKELVIVGIDGPDVPNLRVMAEDLGVPVEITR